MKSTLSVIIALASLSSVLLFTSCNDSSSNDEDPVNGYWEQVGYGRLVSISSKAVTFYDTNSMSCVESLEVPREYLSRFGTIVKATQDSLVVKGGITSYLFTRSDVLPVLCEEPMDTDDPVLNFEALWHTFNEQYCYFDTRNIDWREYYKEYRSKINENTSPLELYLVMEEMLNSIGDGHISIPLPEKLEEAYDARQAQQTPDEDDEPSTSDLRRGARRGIVSYYLDNVEEYHKGLVRWGDINDSITYVQINAMEYFANYDLPEEAEQPEYFDAYMELADEDPDYTNSVVKGAGYVMERILKDRNSKAYIMDIRFNGGGFDEVGMTMLSHFITDSVMVFSKKARLGDGYTPKQIIRLSPRKPYSDSPVFLLISGETASAAEIMTLCGQAMSNVTLVGSNTEGVFSDILEKTLPNGWSFGMSNEVYESFEGKDYESLGIPPDWSLPYPRSTREFYLTISEEIKNGDDAIEMVLDSISR